MKEFTKNICLGLPEEIEIKSAWIVGRDKLRLTVRERKTWEPKYGERYQSITFDDMNGEFCVYKPKWYDNKEDHCKMKLGWAKPINESSEAALRQLCDKLNEAIKNIR